MAFSTQKNFFAEINDISVKDVAKKFDYSKLSLEERKQIVDEMLNGPYGNFFHEYFETYFKVNIATTDFISEEINVCSLIERMANYLLASEEIKRQDLENKTEYRYYKDSELFKKALLRESNIETITGDGEAADNILHFLLSNEKNQKVVKNVSVNAGDLKRGDEISSILKDYDNFSKQITEEIKNPESKDNRFLLTRIKGSLKEDMNITKTHLLGVFGEHMNPKESTKYDVSLFDLSNKAHLLGMNFTDSKGKKHFANGLLSMRSTDNLDDNFNLLIVELEGLVNECDLNDTEKAAIELFRCNKSIRGIAEELNITPSKCKTILFGICRKIGKQNEIKKKNEVNLNE